MDQLISHWDERGQVKTFIYKKPVRLSLARIGTLLLVFALSWFFIPDTSPRFVILFVVGSALVFAFVGSLVAPYMSGVLLEGGRIEQITAFGGLIVVAVDDLDRERSMLSPAGLHLVPSSGEALIVSVLEYGHDDILRIAHYAGLSDAGWAQEV